MIERLLNGQSSIGILFVLFSASNQQLLDRNNKMSIHYANLDFKQGMGFLSRPVGESSTKSSCSSILNRSKESVNSTKDSVNGGLSTDWYHQPTNSSRTPKNVLIPRYSMRDDKTYG